MFRERTRLIRIALLGLFACVSILGQGLHLLPGANPFSLDQREAGCRFGCSHHCRSFDTNNRTDSERSTETDEDSCPICQLLANLTFELTSVPACPELETYSLLDALESEHPICEVIFAYAVRGPPRREAAC